MGDVIRVAIADDHPVVRRGLRAFLDSLDDIEVVGEAVDGEAAVRLAVTKSPMCYCSISRCRNSTGLA